MALTPVNVDVQFHYSADPILAAVDVFQRFANDLTEFMLGPKAATRKRPRRIAKRIQQRDGRLRFRSTMMRPFR